MGLDPGKIKYLHYLLQSGKKLRLEDIVVKHNGAIDEKFFDRKTRYLDFLVAKGWESIKFNL